jgi:hypothetical protein
VYVLEQGFIPAPASQLDWLPVDYCDQSCCSTEDAVLRECRQSSRPSTKYGTRIILEPIYEVRPRKDHRGVDLISVSLPFGRLWYGEPDAISNAVDYAKFFSRSRDAVIRVYDEAGNVIETHEDKGEFKGAVKFLPRIMSSFSLTPIPMFPIFWVIARNTNGLDPKFTCLRT